MGDTTVLCVCFMILFVGFGVGGWMLWLLCFDNLLCLILTGG